MYFPSAHQIGADWYSSHPREWPPRGYAPNGYPQSGAFFSWMLQITPFLEQRTIYEQVSFSPDASGWPWWQYQQGMPQTGANTLNGIPLKVFQCPSDSRSSLTTDFGGMNVALTAYLGVSGLNQFQESGGQNGILYVNSGVRIGTILDGTSNTVMVGERPPSDDLEYGWWFAGAGYHPHFGTADVVLGVAERQTPTGPAESYRPGHVHDPTGEHRWHFWSLHSGGGHFLLADGSVRFIPYSASAILPALASRAGREPAALP